MDSDTAAGDPRHDAARAEPLEKDTQRHDWINPTLGGRVPCSPAALSLGASRLVLSACHLASACTTGALDHYGQKHLSGERVGPRRRTETPQRRTVTAVRGWSHPDHERPGGAPVLS